jgi:hypothetical protein
MGFVSEWFEAARDLITSPTEFYTNENRRDGFGFPLKFAAFSFLISGIFSAARMAVFQPETASQLGVPVAAGVTFVSSIIGGIIGLIIGAGLIHIFVALFGGESGYAQTLGVFGYATALTALGSVLSLIPLVGGLAGLLLGLYGIYVQARGLEQFQDISFGKSVLAIILPGLILGAIVLVIFMMTAASFAALLGASAGV